MHEAILSPPDRGKQSLPLALCPLSPAGFQQRAAAQLPSSTFLGILYMEKASVSHSQPGSWIKDFQRMKEKCSRNPVICPDG